MHRQLIHGVQVKHRQISISREDCLVTDGWSSHLSGRTLELQQHHGAGTLHDVEVKQQWLFPVETHEQKSQRKKKNTHTGKVCECV